MRGERSKRFEQPWVQTGVKIFCCLRINRCQVTNNFQRYGKRISSLRHRGLIDALRDASCGGTLIRMFLRNIPHEPTGGGGTRYRQGRQTTGITSVRSNNLTWRGEAPRIIYFGTSRRQIVCPHVRSATENSVVTSAVASPPPPRRSLAREIKLHRASLLRSPYNPPTDMSYAVKPACLHARA